MSDILRLVDCKIQDARSGERICDASLNPEAACKFSVEAGVLDRLREDIVRMTKPNDLAVLRRLLVSKTGEALLNSERALATGDHIEAAICVGRSKALIELRKERNSSAVGGANQQRKWKLTLYPPIRRSALFGIFP